MEHTRDKLVRRYNTIHPYYHVSVQRGTHPGKKWGSKLKNCGSLLTQCSQYNHDQKGNPARAQFPSPTRSRTWTFPEIFTELPLQCIRAKWSSIHFDPTGSFQALCWALPEVTAQPPVKMLELYSTALEATYPCFWLQSTIGFPLIFLPRSMNHVESSIVLRAHKQYILCGSLHCVQGASHSNHRL